MTDSCWPMKSQNTRHTGLSHYSTYGNNGVVKWKYRVDGSINSGAIIDNNNYIYFGVNNFFLFTASKWVIISTRNNDSITHPYSRKTT